MSQFDFPNAQLPALRPLENSYAENQEETELKALFLQVFREYLSEKLFDVNVSGAMHLGSYDLVRKMVNADGLALLQGDRVEAACRYLYRAWMSRDNRSRGMYFLRTYLQLLFPNLCAVDQMWHEIGKEYPNALHSSFDDNGFTPDPETMYLTSRIEIALDLTISTRSITTLTGIFRSILPARLVPQFRFWLVFDATIDFGAGSLLELQKDSSVNYPWAGLYVSEDQALIWYLGDDADPEGAPKLVQGRISAEMVAAYEMPLPKPAYAFEVEIKKVQAA